MTEHYGNQYYPHSRRLYSRPFSGYHGSDKNPRSAVDCLREDLLELGELLIGGPFDMCCDMSYADPRRGPRQFWPFRSQEEAVSGSRAVFAMKMKLPPTAGIALDGIVAQVKECAKTEDVPGSRNSVRRVVPYDMEKLKRDFLMLWDGDFMIDPRLTHAEELFMNVGDGPAAKHYHYDFMSDVRRIEATLHWVRAPQNAARVAQAFLYSRLAQHFGETQPLSVKIAIHAAHEIDAGRGAGLIETLRSDPESLAVLARGDNEEPSPLAYMFRKSATMPGILNPDSLADTAERMVADYTRLKNGAWADAQLALCGLAAAPVPAPAADAGRARGITI